MKFEVRKATLNDADFIVSSMIKSSRSSSKKGFFDLMFGDISEEKLYAQVKSLVTDEKKLYCHFSNFVVAHSSDKMLGTICGYESKLFAREKFLEVLNTLECSDSYENVLSTYDGCVGDMGKNKWMLDFLTVDDGVDEFEISNALLNKSLLNARLKGYREVRTIVEVESTEVTMMYKNLDFAVKSENKNEYYEEMFHSLGLVILELHL